ncbi:hypothetical protein RhiirC2_777434 [Rhizophagus irregularis]|uniref:Ion transport domain-containing protein n=1 Tax=Rhizophagus irregularis TaxID=588596 RepID=A0A2N1NEA8_9GLOM|nr:hypothetical protein RhiirC2_777434 [Rhizophagus irregularis]
MENDIESGNHTSDYVAISPDGSIVAKLSPCNDNYSIVIKKKEVTNAIISYRFGASIPKDLLGWSLAVSDNIDNGNDIGLVAISCITNNDIFRVDKQFLSSWSSSEGTTELYEFSFRNDRITRIRDYRLGGIVSFLKNSERPSNIATLICMNYMKIQKLNINVKLNGKSEECSYMLPKKLFKELENVKDAEKNWKYLLKSRYQEFLMTDTSDNEQMQYIEIYNINTSKLMNVFHRHHGEDDFLISRNNEPGIFAVSTDSRLFAYSYGDNVIVLYLMESGLEIVSKRFDSVCKIKFLEFIEKDKKLFIIEKDKDGSVKFHIWLILGCLNDYFPNISKDNITISETPLSKNDVSTLSNCSKYYHILTKANGTIVFLNDKKFRIILDTNIKKTTIGESDRVTDEHEYNSHDLEPWNQNNSKRVIGKFLNNDKSALLITGQNSIQVWKPKSKNFETLNDFKNFENSNLVYILIIERNPPKFQINDDMTTIITHACKSLTYLYMHTKDITSKKRNQKFVSGTINIIKDFIKKYPDNWKLMEVQYPLMAYLIYSRSFSLIKYILFDNNDTEEKSAKKLHRPQSRYGSYPYYNDLESYLKPYVDSDCCLKSANNLELSLLICKSRDSRRNRDSVMLAYLLEYYSENSMAHIGWMINVTKILPKLSEHGYDNYLNSLYYKPCFGEMKYNFSSNIFQTSANKDTLKVYVPLTRLIPINSFNIFNYAKISDDILSDIYMVPLPNFTTYDPKIKAKTGIVYFLRKILLPPGYKNLDNNNFSSFLKIEKKKSTFFNIPAMEAVMNSRWNQTRKYWMLPLILYVIFLGLFSFLSWSYLIDKEDLYFSDMREFVPKHIIGLFYYTGIYLLAIEFSQMKKYKSNYFTLFNILDLSSIVLGIFNFTLILIFNGNYGEWIILATSVTTLILWIELLLLSRLFSIMAINIFIFGNILKIIIPFFGFMLILTIGFGHSMFVLFSHPSFTDLNPSNRTYTLKNGNGTEKLTLTETNPDNPFDTIWNAILSTYYWSTLNLNVYEYWPLKLLFFLTHVTLVLVLLNMIIALMNGEFNKAKEDGKLGLLMYREELIDDYERLDDPFSNQLYNDSPYICFLRDSDLMKKWISKSQELKKTKLYSWFSESTGVDEEKITFSDDNIKSWYKAFISSNEN